MLIMRRSLGYFLAAAIIVGGPRPLGAGDSYYHTVCRPAISNLVELIYQRPIAIGCDLWDCWPAEALPSQLDWDIRFEGSAFESLELEFRDSPPPLPGLGLVGVEMTEKGFLVRPPGGRITHLPMMFDGGDPLLWPRLTPYDGEAEGVDAPSEGTLVIDQMHGAQIVSSWRLAYTIEPCLPPSAGLDAVQLITPDPSTRPSDHPVVLADLPSSAGCRDDATAENYSPIPGDQVPIGQASPPPSPPCPSEVAVLSKNHALSFEPGVNPPWTNGGEVHPVTLQPTISVDVSVWLVRTGANTCSSSTEEPTCWSGDFSYVNSLLTDNRVGVLLAGFATDLSGDSTAVSTIGSACDKVASIQSSSWYTPGRLNVYYVSGVAGGDGGTGLQCSDAPRAGPNIIFIGSAASASTLAHEIGHAYGLRPTGSGGHTNLFNPPQFSSSNIMWAGGGSGRDYFSLGQVFRMNVHPSSMLNVNCEPPWSTDPADCERRAPTRYCEPSQVDQSCPPLSLGPP